MKISKITLTFLCLFALTITGTRLKAQGDDCNSAAPLTNLNNYCSTPKQFTNGFSTQSGYGIPSCWGGGTGYDVWFRFTAIGTDVQMSVTGDGTSGAIREPRMVLYSGTCGGQVIELVCNASATGVNTVSQYKGGLVPGTVYLIRIGTTFSNRGAFKFCISNYTPTVNPGADCDGAVKLCDMSDVKVAGLSGGGKNTLEIEGNSCFKNLIDPTKKPTEGNSSWYKWTCAKSGTLTFDIIPNDPTNDLDFILYELTSGNNPCVNRSIIRCTATGCPIPNGIVGLNTTSTDVNEPMTNQGDPTACSSPTINGYLKYVDMVAGKTYVLMVDNASSASGFTIKFGGSGIFLGPSAKITATGIPVTCVGEQVIYNGSTSNNYDALKWTFVGGTPGSQTTVGPHTVTYSAQGTYKTYLKASDATCASGNSIDSVTVTVNAATTTSNAGSAQTVCGTDATLAANTPAAGTGTWTLVSGKGTITSPNSPTSTVTLLGEGPNVFRWTIANPPCSSSTSTVTITGVGVPSKADAGADQIICGATSASLSGNIPATGTGKWTLVSGTGTITNPNQPNTTVTGLGLGKNVFRWSIANPPCSDATADVVIKRADFPVIDTTNMTIKAPSCSQSDGYIHGIIVTANSAITYIWNTVTYPSADINNIPAGSYTLVARDADGCSSTMGPISVVNPNPPNKPVIVSGGNVCVGQPIKVWVQNPLPNVIYTWTGPTGNPLGTGDTIHINNPTLPDMGNYSATGSLFGCTGSTGSAIVNVYELPKPVITGTQAICPGTATDLSAINSVAGGNATIVSYKWVMNGVPVIPGNTPVISATKEGDYKVIIKNSNGCIDSSALKNIKFYKPPVIDEKSVVVDSTNCTQPTGAITKITATGAPVLNYTWYSTPPTTPVFSSTTTADLKDVIAGNYFLVVTDGNTCKDTSALYSIKNFHTPTKPGTSGDKVYCEGESLDPLTATGSGGIYTWYDANMTKIFTGNVYTPTFTKTGTLYISETVNGCTSKMDTVVIIINPLPTGNAGPDKHILCSGPTIKLDGTGSTGNFNYSWVPASGVASGGTTLTPLVKDAGTYTLTVTDALTGCHVSDEVVVIKDPVPVASFTANPLTGEAPLTVNFTNTSAGSNVYEWEFGDKNTSTDLNPTNIFINAGEYKVKLTASDNGNCPSIAYVTIKAVEKLVYIIPNVFTPNGDGKNDLYTITSTGIEELTGEIYDRWGLRLFSWNQKNDGWDGRSPSGAAATDGTYFYIIKIKPQNGSDMLIEKGQVTLIR